MAILKAGDWCLYKDRVVRVMSSRPKSGRYLIEFRHNEEGFFSYVDQRYVTKLPEELYPILSDSILNKEEL